jgi:hypothetical protein
MTSTPQGSTAAIALDASRVSDEGGWVAITRPKCVLLLTQTEFLKGLRRGKAYRRRQALRGRLNATGGAGRRGKGNGRAGDG